VWSRYATDLYAHLRDRARRGGWTDKLVYLLYEGLVTADDAPRYEGFEGLSLQAKPDKETGLSRNPHIAALQVAGAPPPHPTRQPILLPPVGERPTPTTAQEGWLAYLGVEEPAE
jgi:hypothetical protein